MIPTPNVEDSFVVDADLGGGRRFRFSVGMNPLLRTDEREYTKHVVTSNIYRGLRDFFSDHEKKMGEHFRIKMELHDIASSNPNLADELYRRKLI